MRNFISAFIFMLGLCSFPTFAGAQSITVDGNPQQFNPGPIERGGRVFVPLRGIFERLGASVVYSGGTINATGSDGRTVSVKIGSTQATVNGAPSYLDVPPFLVGEYTYVPLRFVSQALGASVSYDSASNQVAITTKGGTTITPVPAQSAVRLRGEEPRRGTSVATNRPTIAADFTQPVDPNTVRVAIDGLDVTDQTTRSQSGIVYAPPSPLQSMVHEVQVRGTDRNGRKFEQSWQFTTGAGPVSTANFIRVAQPVDGSTVRSSFTVTGTTRPGAHVRVTAGATANAFPGLSFGTGSYTGDTTADGAGNFAVQASLNTVGGGTITLTAVSTDTRTGETAQTRIRLRT